MLDLGFTRMPIRNQPQWYDRDCIPEERPFKRARLVSFSKGEFCTTSSGTRHKQHDEPCSSSRSNYNQTVPRSIKPLPIRKASQKRVEPPQLSGSFDLFWTSSSIPSPQQTGSAENNPARLNALYISQSTSTSNAQIFIPRLDSHDLSGEGLMRSVDIRDPLNRECLDVALSDIRVVDTAPYLDDQQRAAFSPHSCICKGPHIVAGARIIGEGCIGDIVDGFGQLKMWCAWVRQNECEDDGLLEVFQGHFELKVFYGEAYEQRGFGYTDDYNFAFWALRSMKRVDETQLTITVA